MKDPRSPSRLLTAILATAALQFAGCGGDNPTANANTEAPKAAETASGASDAQATNTDFVARDITPRSAVPKHDGVKKTVEIPNFRIGGKYDFDDPASYEHGGVGGVTLESLGAGPLKLSYIDVGTPKKNDKGEIINAVVINSYYSGDATNMYENWFDGQGGNAFSGGALIGKGKLLDTDKYYIVMVDAVGLWGGSKPSDGLGMKFPQYSYQDMVQATYRLLRDQLNVGHANLITGASMGATQTYVWGVQHPDFMDALMPIGGTTQSDGDDPVGKWTFQLMTAALRSDPVWQKTGGDYYHLPKEEHPNKGVEFGWSILNSTGFSFDLRSTQDWDEQVKPYVYYWKYPDEGSGKALQGLAGIFDAVDLLYRNEAGNIHNINDELHRIKARTLMMHVQNDNWLNSLKAVQAHARIPGAELILKPSPLAHYMVFSFPNVVKDDPRFTSFWSDLETLSNKAEPQFEVENFTQPAVAENIDAKKPFWDHVTYPFPVKYADTKDSRGHTWTIGYMDEYAGNEKDPKTLVIVHGKGAFGAHYGNIIKHALEQGLRVIVPDIPGYGVSGPKNLDRDPARSLQHVREAFHDLIVDQLGVKKAYYLGHSLGGQIINGFAVTYPDNVAGLILEGPAGLEEYTAEVDVMGDGKMVKLFDPKFHDDFKAWKRTWDPLGMYKGEFERDEQGVLDFFYWKTRDASGNQIPGKAGYFLRDTPYARLHTDQRLGMIKGRKADLEQWVTYFIYDVHNMPVENLKDDPNSLYKRLAELKMPIFLQFGAQEPFIPSGPLNGLTDLPNDVIKPYMEMMTKAGNKPLLKVYPTAAHFIHTDDDIQTPIDVVNFVKTGKVDETPLDKVDEVFAAGKAANNNSSDGGDAGSTSTKGLNK
jgi:homoserine O-acetyltransferase